MRVLGMMSGTSLDGVDAVVVECRDGTPPVYLRHWSRRFPAGLRARLLDAAGGGGAGGEPSPSNAGGIGGGRGGTGAWACGQLHHDLGRFYAGVAVDGLAEERIGAVGLHGQTVFHRPDRTSPATWQIGEPAYLAEALRVPVVANFRVADLAAGGQGAPLATLFHVRVFARPGAHVAVHNLGGISNVTSIDARGRGRGAPRVRSFDTGPANLLLDLAMARVTAGRRRLDRGGRMAARGTACEGLLRVWLRHSFLRKAPPKSTGREEFGSAFLERCWAEMDAVEGEGGGLRAEDRLATLAEFTARSVALNYRLHLAGPPESVILCGGGANNPDLVARLGRALAGVADGVRVTSCADHGWPVEAMEGGAFALLAYERLRGRPGNLPGTTGARRAVLCGQVVEA